MFKGNTSKEHKIYIALCALIFAIVLAIAGFLVYKWWENNKLFNEDTDLIGVFTSNDGYDFDKLSEKYPDIIAWIDIPNTNISQPIVQSPDNDYFYLSHNAKQEQDVFGAAYIELNNQPNFSDPVTVIYGHNMNDDSMFSTAHYYEDTEFFNNNDKFFIYKPGHKMTYRVVSAFAYDNRHIINTNANFVNKDSLLKWYSEICNPKSHVVNVRQGINLTENDKVVHISTCMTDIKFSNERYIVSGVLINDRETN